MNLPRRSISSSPGRRSSRSPSNSSPENELIMKKIVRLFLAIFLSAIFSFAQGTQTWQQRSYEDFSKGTSKGIALRSDGTLELAPVFDSIYTSPSTYIWCAVSQPDGTLYLGTGSPARVYRVTPDGRSSV